MDGGQGGMGGRVGGMGARRNGRERSERAKKRGREKRGGVASTTRHAPLPLGPTTAEKALWNGPTSFTPPQLLKFSSTSFSTMRRGGDDGAAAPSAEPDVGDADGIPPPLTAEDAEDAASAAGANSGALGADVEAEAPDMARTLPPQQKRNRG